MFINIAFFIMALAMASAFVTRSTRFQATRHFADKITITEGT
jgi:hypothetical protein